jgi:hypothetical protein
VRSIEREIAAWEASAAPLAQRTLNRLWTQRWRKLRRRDELEAAAEQAAARRFWRNLNSRGESVMLENQPAVDEMLQLIRAHRVGGAS